MGDADKVMKVHEEATVVDMMQVFSPIVDAGYFKTLKEAGVSVIHTAIPPDDLNTMMSKLAKLYDVLEQAENAVLATSFATVKNAKRDGKVAVIVGIQDSVPFEKDLDLLKTFHKLGIRIVQLAYSKRNYFGTGCFESKDSGLSELGVGAVKELNRLGILIDVSHCGNKTVMDVLETSKDPVAFTHATPSTLVEMGTRAKSDELIKALAEKGGVTGQMIWTPFCERRDKKTRPAIDDFVDLLSHIVNLTSVDHVGLGLDTAPFFTKEYYKEWAKHAGGMMLPHKTPTFEEKYVAGFDNIIDLPKITKALLSHGYSEQETTKILGKNWLDLLSKVWK
jgi:membrane dipeptidase